MGDLIPSDVTVAVLGRAAWVTHVRELVAVEKCSLAF